MDILIGCTKVVCGCMSVYCLLKDKADYASFFMITAVALSV